MTNINHKKTNNCKQDSCWLASSCSFDEAYVKFSIDYNNRNKEVFCNENKFSWKDVPITEEESEMIRVFTDIKLTKEELKKKYSSKNRIGNEQDSCWLATSNSFDEAYEKYLNDSTEREIEIIYDENGNSWECPLTTDEEREMIEIDIDATLKKQKLWEKYSSKNIIKQKEYIFSESFLTAFFDEELKDKPTKESKKNIDCLKTELKKPKLVYNPGLNLKNVYVVADRKVLLNHINIGIDTRNELIMVLGSSGCGKSTLFKAILHLDNSLRVLSTSSISYLDDKSYSLLNKYDLKELRKRNIFHYMHQNVALEPSLTVEDTIRQYAEGKGILLKTKEIKDLCSEYGLINPSILQQQIKTLSGGQLKRLALCRAKLLNPKVYILDEPDSGLDEPSAKALVSKLHDIVVKEHKSVIVISHHPHSVFIDMYHKENSIDNVFTKLLVLAKVENPDDCLDEGGTIAFYGSPKNARSFFDLDETDVLSKIVEKTMPKSEGGQGLGQYYIRKWRNLSYEK